MDLYNIMSMFLKDDEFKKTFGVQNLKEYMKDYPKYTVDRLDYTEELRCNMKRKTFYVDFPTYEDELLILCKEKGWKTDWYNKFKCYFELN